MCSHGWSSIKGSEVFHLGLFFFSIRCASARRMAGLPIWMKVGQGKKWTFFSIGCCHGIRFCFRITFCSSVRRCFGNRCSFIGWCSSRVWKRGFFFRRRSNFFSFAEDETYKRHPGIGSQPPEEKGGGNWVGVPFFGGFAARSYTSQKGQPSWKKSNDNSENQKIKALKPRDNPIGKKKEFLYRFLLSE